MASGYPIESIRIRFIANEDDIGHFSYLSPLDYDNKVSRIWFPPTGKEKGTLPYERSVYIHVPLLVFRKVSATPTTASNWPQTTTSAMRGKCWWWLTTSTGTTTCPSRSP